MVGPLGLLVEGDRVAKIVSMEMIESPLAWISGTDESLQAEATRYTSRSYYSLFVRSLGVEVVEAVVSIRPLNVVLADRSSAVTSSGRKGLWLWFERELRRLECSINFKSLGSGRALSLESAGSVSVGSWSGALLILGVFTRVYDPYVGRLREDFWEELGTIRGLWQDPWCIGGDFNVVTFLRERNKVSRLSSTMRRFSEVIEDLELRDLPLQGGFSPLKASLKLPFTEEEVHLALMGMNGDKAPGLDGFTGAFWQFCWEFVKEEILEMFKEFHEQKAFLKSLNTTFLVLIPKKGGAEELGDFRPISLVGGCINSWLRQILDASLIANEVIDSWKKRGEKGLICKLDIEKAYDSVNWKFLMRVMQKWGLGTSARRPPIPILVHYGDGGVERLYSEGCGRGLHFRVQDSEGQGASCEHFPPSFADDAIVFCEAKKDDMTFLSWILCWFEAASGLRINLAKSEIIPVGEVEEILEMAVELGCKVGKDEVEVGPLEAAIHIKGGRIALIKSTLVSMPLYQMSLFRMPRVVARRLEKLQRDFLWGGGSMERKAHLVNWERVCMGKEKGGLGLRKLIPLNKALLGKWVWRFANAKEEMWKRVLVAKYGQEEFGWRLRRQMGFLGLGFGRRS
ncbi:putative ribonuclease H protein [Vitis vinifera]|uniref:Putative ribonuclease H protein n=1 Tax=Vitis vinifera TaxID=29760 RepID=A0A438I217_VITVI|nr:putative ribonuclease H protein [Vitis vinifera]